MNNPLSKALRLNVKDLMVSPVINARLNAKVGEIKEVTKSENIHAMPVVDLLEKESNTERVIKGTITNFDLEQCKDDSIRIQGLELKMYMLCTKKLVQNLLQT